MMAAQRGKSQIEKALLVMFSWVNLFLHLGGRKQLLDESTGGQYNKK